MVMRIDDGEVGFEDGFGRALGEPHLVRSVNAPELGRPRGGRHADFRISAAQRSRTGSTSSALAAGRLKMARATPASWQRQTASTCSATPKTVTGMLVGSRPAAVAIFRNSGKRVRTSS